MLNHLLKSLWDSEWLLPSEKTLACKFFKLLFQSTVSPLATLRKSFPPTVNDLALLTNTSAASTANTGMEVCLLYMQLRTKSSYFYSNLMQLPLEMKAPEVYVVLVKGVKHLWQWEKMKERIISCSFICENKLQWKCTVDFNTFFFLKNENTLTISQSWVISLHMLNKTSISII